MGGDFLHFKKEEIVAKLLRVLLLQRLEEKSELLSRRTALGNAAPDPISGPCNRVRLRALTTPAYNPPYGAWWGG